MSRETVVIVVRYLKVSGRVNIFLATGIETFSKNNRTPKDGKLTATVRRLVASRPDDARKRIATLGEADLFVYFLFGMEISLRRARYARRANEFFFFLFSTFFFVLSFLKKQIRLTQTHRGLLTFTKYPVVENLHPVSHRRGPPSRLCAPRPPFPSLTLESINLTCFKFLLKIT